METVTMDDIKKLLYDITLETEKRRQKSELAAEENERKLKEELEQRRKDFEEEMKQRQKYFDGILGKMGASHGDFVESMFVNLGPKFNEFGYNFPRENKGQVIFRGENRQIIAEVDHLLENGTSVMAVEVKSKLKQDDVDYHIERLKELSEYFTKSGDNRKILGAVAGCIVPENIIKYAQNKGLFVLVQNGENIELSKPPKNFKPYEW